MGNDWAVWRKKFLLWFHVRRAQQCEAGRKEQGERDEGKGGRESALLWSSRSMWRHSFV